MTSDGVESIAAAFRCDSLNFSSVAIFQEVDALSEVVIFKNY